MHGGGDVIGPAFAAQRRVRDDPLPRDFVECFIVRPQYRPRRDRIDADFRREFARERMRHADQCGLRDRVNHVVLERPFGMNVRNVDDCALRFAKRRRGRLRQEQRTLNVRAHQIVPSGDRDFADRGLKEGRRIVDQSIESAERLQRLLDQ